VSPQHVALTVDSGPDPVSTPFFVDALAEAGVRATFFVIGERLARHRWLGRLLAAAGHELAVYGWRRALLVPGRSARRELFRTINLITDVTGAAPRWFRPPYGLLLPGCAQLVRDAGLEPVLAATPWRRVGAARLWGGATVLLHDRTRAGLDLIPRVVALAHRRGLRIGPLAEHGLGRTPLRALIHGPVPVGRSVDTRSVD
jgi:peptidoglycan-N-acetylglucosamine deacetylase